MHLFNKLSGNVLFIAIVGVVFYSCKTARPDFQQQYAAFDYQVSAPVLGKRIFYLLYEINRTTNVRKDLVDNTILESIRQRIIVSYADAIKRSSDLTELSTALFINDSVNDAVKNELGQCYHTSKELQAFVHDKIRASHHYALNESLSDSLLLLQAWDEQVKGINHIFSAYLQHKDLTYAVIDSAKYSTQSESYFDSVKHIMDRIVQEKNNQLFFVPSLSSALAVLQINGRNEAGRMIPLSSVNGAAYKKAKSVNWSQYPYSSILVYGAGPGKTGVHFSSEGKIRCDSALALYKKKLAPFIIVSGGFVHPFMTPYCEAIEMRNYLVNKCNVPTSDVIIEPHARHTTTNLRNANRILIENRFPLSKPVLGVSSKSHIDYIADESFLKIFRRDIGFVPFTDMTRIAPCEASYLPALTSMQIDSDEPLDP